MNLPAIFGVIILTGLQQVLANSLIDPYICGPPTCSQPTKFKYSLSMVYHYVYSVDVNTWFSGSTNNQSTLNVKAGVSIQFMTPCEGLMRLSNVSIIDQDENYQHERSQKFIQSISHNDLRFAFHDGYIMEMCPSANEEDWVLNFKRGILSVFQNTMERFDIDYRGIERDVHGTCNVEYHVRGQENTSLVLVKSRDLTECTDRYKYMSILQTVRYNFQSKYQTWPVLKSESKCRVTVDHSVYTAAECRERHLFEPFSGRQSGALTTVEQRLHLAAETNKTDSETIEEKPTGWTQVERRAGLVHQHAAYSRPATGELRSAREVLKLLCKIEERGSGGASTVDENLDSGSVVGLWGSVVRACRSLHYPDLAHLLARAPAICPAAKKHLLDALPYVASIGSVELIKDMIIRGAVDADTEHEWLMSMAMIPRPKKEMIVSMVELVKAYSTDKVVSFTASSMVHSYCKHSSKTLRECCEEDHNAQIMEVFQNIVQQTVKDPYANLTREERDKATVSIKALGNIGGFKAEFADVLISIVESPAMPTALKLTAIDAFRKTPCTETREYFLHLFREDFVDIEVRLASYLQVMKCPDLVTVRKIFHALKLEPVNQAATFVWSHLNNLAQSSLPSRVEVQGLLGGNTPPQLEDSPDFRRFSRNYEQSLFFDQYNAGGNYEANVIFSPDSYLPRSVSLNLTIDMFGESINLLELRARGEGFERYFEQIFGPNATLNKDKMSDNLANYRFYRSVEDADEVHAKIDSLGYENQALKHQYPMADLGIKVFGNEISYWTADGDSEIKDTLRQLNPLYQINKILSGKEISYKKASLFLDTTYSVPTGCGLPLKMNLMGSSYVDVRMLGTVSGAEAFWTTRSLDFEGKIQPSVALNVAATMGVVAGSVTSTGIRLNMRLYTATAVEAKLKVRGTRLVDLDLSLPYDKQEIFGAKSELIVLHGDKELQQQGLNKNRIAQDTCSWSTFDRAIGVKICASYQFPNVTDIKNAPYFIMSGPSKYLVSLEKVDPSAKTYALRYKWESNDTANTINFSFNTPNSKAKRMFNATFQTLADSGSAIMLFQSAENTLKAHATYKNTPDDKFIETALDIDGQKHFDAVASLKKHPLKNGYVYLPHFYIVVNNERISELSGTLRLAQKKGVSQCEVGLEFQTKRLASRLQGYILWNGATRSAKLKLDYQFYKDLTQSIDMEGLLSVLSQGRKSNVYGELGLAFTSYPHLNFFAAVKYLGTPSHIDTTFNMSATKPELLVKPKVQFVLVLHKKLSGSKIDTHLKLMRPEIALNFQFEETGARFTTLAVLSYDPKARDVSLSGTLFYPPGTQLYVDAAVNVTLPSLHPLVLKTRVHEKKVHEYAVEVDCVWFTGLDLKVDALYQDTSTTLVASHRLKALVLSQHMRDIAADLRFTQDNSQITFYGQGEYNDGKYGAYLRYIVHSERNYTAFGQLDWTGKTYTINLSADLNNNSNVQADLHLDQVRDVHLTYQRWLTDKQKKLSAVVNWDVNRDPSQKVALDVQLDTKATWHYAGLLSLYYPGRLLDGQFEFLLKDWFCEWLVRLGWSPEDALLWKVNMYSKVNEETVYALFSQLDSPFEGWKDSSFNLIWRYRDNMQAINGSMAWQREHLSFGLLADYMLKTNEFHGELTAAVNSTIPALPRAAAVARHSHVWKKNADTLFSFQYNNDGKLMINSSWQLDRGDKENNITGRVTLDTPFQGYKKGLLRTKFVFGHKRDLHGITYMDLDEKVFKISVDGHMRRITNCMLAVNVTSPAAQAPLMAGRFGLVEAERHLVAMVTTPNSTTGVELLLALVSTQRFNLYGHVALPVQFLNRALLRAKRADEEVDFRLGWDSMDFGFTGIWHYQSVANFQYLYKLYTPLAGFEENGCVLKNIFDHGLDTEFSIQLSKHKFGIAILMRDTDKGLLEVLNEKLQNAPATRPDLLLDNFETHTDLTLDTLYYPTITFSAHVIKYEGVNDEEIFKMDAKLNLPNNSLITLTDTFVLEDYATMHNKLHLKTPFTAVQELKSVYTVEIVMREKYNVTFSALLFNGTEWYETCGRVFYEYESGEEGEWSAHSARVSLATWLDVLPALDAALAVHAEDALTRMSADVSMPSFNITARGQIEIDQPFVESSGSLNLTSPHLQDYFISMEFRKDFSDVENSVGGGIRITQGQHNNYLFADTTWRGAPSRHLKVRARAALVPVLPPSELTARYTDDATKDAPYRVLSAEGQFGKEENFYSLNVDQKGNLGTFLLHTPLKGYRNVHMVCELKEDKAIAGTLTSDGREYAIEGTMKGSNPIEVTVMLTPKGQGNAYNVRVRLDMLHNKYVMSATFAGPITFVAHSKLELETNYTDINFSVDLPQSDTKALSFKSRVDVHPDEHRTLSVTAVTPLQSLEYLKADADFLFGPKTGYVLCNYNVTNMHGDGDLKWSFLIGDFFLTAIGHQNLKGLERSVKFDVHFGNSTDADSLMKTDAGFGIDLDKVWQIGANVTFGFIQDKKVLLLVNTVLPRPNVDVHTLSVVSDVVKDRGCALDVKYFTDVTRVQTAASGNYIMGEDSLNGNLSLVWGAGDAVKRIDNVLRSRAVGNHSLTIDYTLATPLYVDDDTFKVQGTYTKDAAREAIIVNGTMHRPGSCRIGEVDLSYGGLRRTKGQFNVSTPFTNLPWLQAIIDVMNEEQRAVNHLDVYWPNKSASLNANHTLVREGAAVGQKGRVSLEIPLSAQHLVSTDYHFLQAGKWSRGNATLDFDDVRFVEGSFHQVLSKSNRNLDLATTDIQIESTDLPIGIKYIHEYDDTGSIDVKEANIFHLHNASTFNLTGIADVLTWDTGKTLKLTAVHSDRSLTFQNDYEAKGNSLRQGSKIRWADDVWLNYNVQVTNTTTEETESQNVVVDVWWPRRAFSLDAAYRLQDTLLAGSARLDWRVHDENRTAALAGKWENPAGNVHLVDLALAHPSFNKDVTLKGSYENSAELIANVSINLQYSDHENEHLNLRSVLKDNSNGPTRDYKFELKCDHPATNLDLEIRSDLNIHSRWYSYDSYYRFQKSLFYTKLRHSAGMLDLRNSLLEYQVENETEYYRLNGTWVLAYPEYRVYAWVNRSNANDTGYAALSLHDKYVTAHFNSSDDISYHLLGVINDARSAQLNAWRDYDDTSTLDVTSYIKLNHSRLLASKIAWRPQISADIKASFLQTLRQAYRYINETLTIVKEAPLETHSALRNIWTDSKPRIREFLDDLNDLHVIKDDLDEFQTFLNESYSNNDFYVKTLVEFTYAVLDDLALRNHLENLPEMVNEMWGMMGDTSKSIKKSLLWVIDTIKTAYAKFVDNVNKLLETDFMDQVSHKMEKAIVQYDDFIKNLHVRLLAYWEATWSNAVGGFVKSWRSFLKSMEPTFLKMVHYAETIVYGVGKEVMHFFYQQTHELTDSPYFNYVSAAGHELDRLWKDVTHNDAITNIKKYSAKLYNAFFERVLLNLPFRKEMEELASEMLLELNKLQELEIVIYVKSKFWEAKSRLQWWYDYFRLGEAFERVWYIMYTKLTEMPRTALDYDEKHRTPKTLFVFDPRKGEILLEQKLPMSWHGFNRTPDFSEISEYKAVKDVLDNWLFSNKTIWSYYYDIKPYLDINNILPPFGGMAIMTGQGTLVTFDKRVYTISEAGTFVLCKDYKYNNFTILMESNAQGRYNLVVLTKKNLIHVDLYRELVSVGASAALTLPAAVEDWVVDREADALTLRGDNGVTVQCNFLFNTCTLRLSGWYFGTVGGLLGTLNNEQYDDMQLINGTYSVEAAPLGRSWALSSRPGAALDNREPRNDTQCAKFFRNKVSPMHACFNVIDATPFFVECMDGVEACALASAYLEMCSQEQIPIHIPEQCVQCTSPQGEVIEEGGQYTLLEGINSTDVVFVMEAAWCNQQARKRRNLDVLVDALDSKLQDYGLTDNRYAVVGFGGSGVFKKPRSLYVKNKVFTSAIEITQHFDNLYIEKRDMSQSSANESEHAGESASGADMFGALSHASSLPFRPGVSRTLILMPCSRCDIFNMKLDYSVIQQVLMDGSITLHIIMEDDFALSKKRVAKTLYGVDHTLAYTAKDARELLGDAELRKQVKLPKEKLGFCSSLAIETNGAIWAGGKLAGERGVARRVSGVVGARVAAAARPRCQRAPACECREARLHCRPCASNLHPLMDISSTFWDSDEVDDIIDNLMGIELPNLSL